MTRENYGADDRTLYERAVEGVENLPELPSRDESAHELLAMREEQFEILTLATTGVVEELEPIDNLVIAALNALERHDSRLPRDGRAGEHVLRALPMIRFQLDSAMRLFAGKIVPKDSDFMMRIMEGEKPSKFKDDRGNKLTDSYLHSRLAEDYPEVTRIYEDTSGFVHLSNVHLVNAFDLRKSKQNKLAFVDVTKLPEWEDREIRGVMVEFIHATSILISICRSWEQWRTTRGAQVDDDGSLGD